MRRDWTKEIFLLSPVARWRGQPEEVPWIPRTDLYRTRSGWVIKMDLAGVEPTEIEVNTRGSCLIVAGTRRDHVVREGWQHYQMEISYNRFERVIEFPESLEKCTFESRYLGGMLLVELFKGGKCEKA
jgi:HSP20 family protein